MKDTYFYDKETDKTYDTIEIYDVVLKEQNNAIIKFMKAGVEMSIKSNIEYINELKAAAAEKSGRTGDDVLLVAVTKLHTPEEMNEAIDAGITDIGGK